MTNKWRAFTAETKTIPSVFIRRAQRRLGFKGRASDQTHVGLLNTNTMIVYEAIGTGIELTDFAHYQKNKTIINFLDKLELPDDVGERAVKFSKEEGDQREYDFKLIFGLLLYSLGLPRRVLDYFNKRNRYICTEYLSKIADKNIFWPAVFYDEYF